YRRIMQMSIPGVVAHLGRQEDYRDIIDLAASFSGARLVEEAVNRSLARSFRHAMMIAPGDMHTLAREYLTRWDITNVMAILRGTVFDVPRQQVRDLLVPAGELDTTLLDRLLGLTTCGEALEALQDWRLYAVLEEYYRICGERGVFARIENELYMNYYAGLLGLVASGCSGCRELIAYLRFEIDITNMKNLLRLRCGEEAC
ncbi:V-type ATPase subunit, partial [Methanoculleus bourgensis]|uniref:V-type ATPase subunit n=1 Tax=Methanoculleus bourgensis TaxID=83986 RepID=UPI003B92F120